MPSAYQVMNSLALAVREHKASSYNYARLCSEYGYERIGEGGFGFVIQHPFVEDRVIKVCTFPADGWIRFALYCLKNPATNLLRVFAMKKYGDIVIADIEKLEPNIDHPARNNIGRYGTPTNPHLNPDDMQRMTDALGPTTDLHDGNWMLRGGTVVLTDPYTEVADSGLYAIERFTCADGKVDITVEQIKEPTPDAGLVANSQVPAVRAADQNNMLRIGSILPRGARAEGISRMVFPMRPAGAGTVRAARIAERERARGRAYRDEPVPGCICYECRGLAAKRLQYRLAHERDIMAAKGRDNVRPLEFIPNWVQPVPLKSGAADLRLAKVDYLEIEQRVAAFYGQVNKAKVPAKVEVAG